MADLFSPWEEIARCVSLRARLSCGLFDAGTFIVLFIRVIGRICHQIIDEVLIQLIALITFVHLLKLFRIISNYCVLIVLKLKMIVSFYKVLMFLIILCIDYIDVLLVVIIVLVNTRMVI